MTIAQRVGRLGVESAFDVLVRARALEAQGRNIVHLEIGEPDSETPAHVAEAGKRAIDEGFTHYGPPQGLPEMREAAAEYIATSRGISVDPGRVCVTPGAKPILFFTMLAVLEPGDEVICPDPGFPIYESVIRFCQADPVPVPLVEERGFSFDLNVFKDRITDRTRMVILNSPQNPTGGVIQAADIREIAELIRHRDILVLSDEIYTRIYFGDRPLSIASVPGMAAKTVILDGFSKTFAMTGWRLVNSNSCTASFTQRAGIAALRGPQDQVERMVAEFRRRRDAFVAGLNTIPGFRCPLPEGAFYAFPNITGTGKTSKELADLLLTEAGVACLSGASFGGHGEGYLRFSIANSFQNLMEAVERIRSFIGGGL